MRIIRYFALILLFASCKSGKFDVTLDKTVPLDFRRFDLAFDSLRQQPLNNNLPPFIAKYSQWLPLYSQQIIRTGDVNSVQFPVNVAAYFAYPEYEPVQMAIQKAFPADSSLPHQLQQAFSYYNHYFPKDTVPAIYTYNGGFNQSIVIGEGFIGVGLDKYLGTGCRYYKQLGIDNYKVQRMHPAQLPYDVLFAHISDQQPTNFGTANVLTEILHQGRIMYLLNACFPQSVDTALWGLSSQKMEWLNASEHSMWEYLIDKKMLFDSDYLTIRKFTGEGPFTAPFSKDSPSRAAVWIGYRIVCQYAEKTGATIPEIFALSDPQQILNKSKYNP